jgi:hypothetical protein
MNTIQILSSKPRFDLMHWNVSIGPEKWPIFGRFLKLFPLKVKHPAQHKKIPPIWRWPSVTSLQVLYMVNVLCITAVILTSAILKKGSPFHAKNETIEVK